MGLMPDFKIYSCGRFFALVGPSSEIIFLYKALSIRHGSLWVGKLYLCAFPCIERPPENHYIKGPTEIFLNSN